MRESSGWDSFGGSVERRGQGTTSDEEPRVELPYGPDVLFLRDGGSEHFLVDSLSSRVAITDEALVVEANRLMGSSPLSLGPQSPGCQPLNMVCKMAACWISRGRL